MEWWKKDLKLNVGFTLISLSYIVWTFLAHTLSLFDDITLHVSVTAAGYVFFVGFPLLAIVHFVKSAETLLRSFMKKEKKEQIDGQ